MVKDHIISRLIFEEFSKKFSNALSIDVSVVGAGPSGLVASYYLAKSGFDVVIFESKLSPGGGMWGGGMMFNEIVLQEEAVEIAKEFGISVNSKKNGYYTADSIESTSALIYKCKKSGVQIFNLIKVEDVILKDNSVQGIVINWSPVLKLGLHVDPLGVKSRAVLDSTGHPAELTNTLVEKSGIRLNTNTGKFEGEKPMNAHLGEIQTVKNTKEIYNNFFVSGMAANGVFGGFRMGPIFGGMLLSGKKVAYLIKEALSKE
jgi:thiamine thiazole synthase